MWAKIRINSQVCFLVSLFFFSRLVAAVYGVTFDDSEIGWFYQFLDIDLLRNDLMRSLCHLHSQPPLLNLLAGIGLKMPEPLGWWFWRALFWGMGLIQIGLLFDGMKRLGTRPWISAGIVAVYMISPAVLLFENLLFYPYPGSTLLLGAVWLLLVHLQQPRGWTLPAFFFVCALLPLFRSLFHLIWLFGVAGIVLLKRPNDWKRVLISASIPILMVSGWYAKNEILFDTFSGSSWMGMNFARATVFRLPDKTREEWIDTGILSKISEIGPFSPLASYEPIIGEKSPTGILCLDNPTKGGSTPNYNHLSYVEISKRYERDAWTLVRNAPLHWMRGIGDAVLLFFRPSQEFALRSGNQSAIAAWERGYDRWMLWQLSPSDINKAVEGRLSYSTRLRSSCLLWWILYPLTFLYGIGQVWRGLRGSPSQRDRGAFYAFLLFNVGYIFLVGNLFEFGENNRFRFLSDPLVLMGTGGTLSWFATGSFRGGEGQEPNGSRVSRGSGASNEL